MYRSSFSLTIRLHQEELDFVGVIVVEFTATFNHFCYMNLFLNPTVIYHLFIFILPCLTCFDTFQVERVLFMFMYHTSFTILNFIKKFSQASAQASRCLELLEKCKRI